MRFQTPLVPGRLVRRYKRFFADVILDSGQEVTAHCPNTGPMTGLVDEGQKVWLEPNDDPKKKLNYGWRLVDHENGHFTGVDTSLPNRVMKETLTAGALPGFEDYGTVLPEQKYGEASRIDFLLKGAGLKDAYIEVKSVTLLRRERLAEFPDTVTDRGRKHLEELAEIAKAGQRAIMLYLVQRTDCQSATLAGDIDPGYVAAFHAAVAAGLEVVCFSCDVSPKGISIARPLPFTPPA